MKGYIYNKDAMTIATIINNVVACNGTTIKGDSLAVLGIGEYVITDLEFNEGDILVTTMTDIEMNPYIEKCAAIITEEGGMTSHAAIVGISLNKPVIVSATNILESVKDGEIVTVDASRGVIYRGSTRVL